MKKLLLLLLTSTLLAQGAIAQEAESEEYEGFAEEVQPTNAKPFSRISMGISSIQWNNSLKLQQGINMAKDYANYSGLAFSIQREVHYLKWGWAAAAFVGAGRAVGGGNSIVVPYEKDKVAFTVYGLSPRVFYRLSGKISAGITMMAFLRNIDWPATTGMTIDSGRNVNVAGLADLNLRIFQQWDFYSGIGPLAEGATFWKVGLNYNF